VSTSPLPRIQAGMITPAEFDARFPQWFTRSAFRLETLDYYDSPASHAAFGHFRAGQPFLMPWRAAWDAMVANDIGKQFSRVHVVSEPLTDYLRFELICYQSGSAAGEDIRILPRRLAPTDLPPFDYWLFDSQAAAIMSYDAQGTWLSTEFVTDPAFVADCCHWRDVTMRTAISLDEYTTGRTTT
jgi:hypothetical protein